MQDTKPQAHIFVRAPVASSSLTGACCLQLVEMMIQLRRDGEPGAAVAEDIAQGCLRVVGLAENEVRAAMETGRELVSAL